MIWTNPVIPMDGFCLVYLFAEIDITGVGRNAGRHRGRH
ncbi:MULTISPECIES: hypothetical protein [Pseudomonas]